MTWAGLLLAVAIRAAGEPSAPVAVSAQPPPFLALTSAPGALEKLRAQLALAAAKRVPSSKPLRIVQVGDSHTEAGYFGRSLAVMLAGGQPVSPGLSWPGMLAASDLQVVRLGARHDWREESWLDAQAPGPFGPRGTAFVTRLAGASIELRVSKPWPASTQLTLYYARQVGSRPAELRHGDQVLQTLTPPTEAPPSSLGVVELPWPAHATSLQLMVGGEPDAGGEFRFFGATVDRPDGVLSVDSLGASGTTADHPVTRDDGAMTEFITRRSPDVLLVWFGSNSAVAQPFDVNGFSKSFAALLAHLQSAAPKASLIVIGPPDLERRPDGCASWAFRKHRALHADEREALHRFACTPQDAVTHTAGGKARYPAEGIETEEQWQQWLSHCSFASVENVGYITEVERAAALSAGGAFFDTYDVMGGAGSMHQWLCQDPPLGDVDHIHLTAPGHDRLVHQLGDAIKTGSR